jgi:hypothetical protein
MLDFYIVQTLPANFTPSSFYLVKSPDDAEMFEMYLSNASGTAVRHVISKSDVTSMIASSMASLSSVKIVPTIPARNALMLTANAFVMVLDASLDPTVQVGAALYLWSQDAMNWTKVSEYESMDVSMRWGQILDGPVSSVARIDAAVAASHQHANQSVLDRVSEDAQGRLMYNGLYITPGLAVSEW